MNANDIVLNPTHQSERLSWFRRSPWLILVTGFILALVVAALLFMTLMQPPLAEMRALISTLAVTSLLSLGLGYLFYKRGWARSVSLLRTLSMTYIWAALLTLFNVGILQQQMFVSRHDLILGGVLLLFAVIIATSFGIFVSASVTDDLRQISNSAQQLAEGDLTTRVAVRGRDEVAQVAHAFNDMADQLEQVEKQRKELERLRRDLIAWASHDLRTPLTSIRVRVEALNDGVVEDVQSQRRYYRDVLSDVMALNIIIDDLLELAQLDAGGMHLEMSKVSLRDLLSDNQDRFSPLAEKRGINLRVEIGKEVDPVSLNATKISRVLDNLLSNALRHTPEGGEILTKAVRDGGIVQVTVEDTGPGFDPDDLPRLFEQFYRGEQARSRTTGGAGLGLAIVKGIIEAHGGETWAKNLPGGGACVGFTVPG
ncbi:MAG: HAMP domain-containing sensor histidine kinase [Candidatus Promineifilaceae bacterium]|nr:HAMP domain-containing sensor histidine kinase [Candidatus Promineifilaceae bacterium]